MTAPLVSVVTPTWQRHEMLLTRCLPSVQAQAYNPVEHVIVSDGPDDELPAQLAPFLGSHHDWPVSTAYRELPGHPEGEHWGSYARLAALDAAHGQYITYCDDDDALRPQHCAVLAAALDDHPEAAFAVSRMLNHHPKGPRYDLVIGQGELAAGNVGTPMIMHRREVLLHGTWGEPSFLEDWNLVWGWIQAGVRYVRVDAVTADVYPSFYRRQEDA